MRLLTGLLGLLVFAACSTSGDSRQVIPVPVTRELPPDLGPKPTQAQIDTAIQYWIRDKMQNPDSFELVQVLGPREHPDRLGTGEDGWAVFVDFRGTNSYGGIVTQTILLVMRDGYPIAQRTVKR